MDCGTCVPIANRLGEWSGGILTSYVMGIWMLSGHMRQDPESYSGTCCYPRTVCIEVLNVKLAHFLSCMY